MTSGSKYHSTCWLDLQWTRICSLNEGGRGETPKLRLLGSEAYNNTLSMCSFRRVQQRKHVNWDEKPISSSNYAFHLVLFQFVVFAKNLPPQSKQKSNRNKSNEAGAGSTRLLQTTNCLNSTSEECVAYIYSLFQVDMKGGSGEWCSFSALCVCVGYLLQAETWETESD